jgi:hypothetical protein
LTIDRRETMIYLVGIAEDYLERAAPGDWRHVGKTDDFNDCPSTTLEDILALYDRAIEIAERDSE